MGVLFLLIGISILLGGLFLFLFIRSTDLGQFDDLESPGIRIILEDDVKLNSNHSKHGTTTF